MRNQTGWTAMGGAVLVCGFFFFATTEDGRAADKKKVQDALLKVADLIEKKDMAGAKKEAAAIAAMDKFDLNDVMQFFKPRLKGGLGLGEKAGAISPDGIESYYMNLEKKAPPPKTLETISADLARSAYVVAAIAEVVIDKCPVPAKKGEKDPAQWKSWTEDMRKSSIELAEAFKEKNAMGIKSAAKKLNESCINCHGPFRE